MNVAITNPENILMWKLLDHEEKVTVGDVLRYRSNSNSSLPEAKNYIVAKTDQHHFEIVEETGRESASEPPRHKAVRYTDIGYNVFLERWCS